MNVLALMDEQLRFSLSSYSRPRMREELKEIGLNFSHPRIGHLMREHGIRIERSKKHKVTTDRNHTFKIASNLSHRGLPRKVPKPKIGG